MLEVIVLDNFLEPQNAVLYNVDHIGEFLLERYKTKPAQLHIYHEQVDAEHDVTPKDEAGIDRLFALEGKFFVIPFPGDPTTIVLTVLSLAASLATSLLSRPKIPAATNRNTNVESPNNSLSERKNTARPNARIPDIFGTVYSVPDLVALPYTEFVEHEQRETAYMCIGKGTYAVSEIRDGTTLLSEIEGTSAAVYGPDTSPNWGTAQQTVGSYIAQSVVSAERIDAVDGQTLFPPNKNVIRGDSDITFAAPNLMEMAAGSADLTEIFEIGDDVAIAGASSVSLTLSITPQSETLTDCRAISDGTIEIKTPDDTTNFVVGSVVEITASPITYTIGSGSVDISGFYIVDSKTTQIVTLRTPGYYNGDWSDVTSANFTDGKTPYVSMTFESPNSVSVNLNGAYEISFVNANSIGFLNPELVSINWWYLTYATAFGGYQSYNVDVLNQEHWVGPYTTDKSDSTEILINAIAQNGLYKDSGAIQNAMNVQLRFEITPVDDAGVPTGSAYNSDIWLVGSTISRGVRAVTGRVTLTTAGRQSIRARRLTDTDTYFSGTVSDEVKWRDLYIFSPAPNHFGDVTTIQVQTRATAGATAIKDRKLNLLASRKIPTRISGSTFTTALTATSSADEIISFVAMDPKIGNRSADEIDFDSIYDTIADVVSYFGTNVASAFNYTFDNLNLSFEETIASIAEAVFCTAYRRGLQLKLLFEKETDTSTLLFNHRNKIPDTESRNIRFGPLNNFDGVEYVYTDKNDKDAVVSLYLPSDMSARNPKKIESIGIRNKLQAYWHINRAYRKINGQNQTVSFEATQEADLLVINNRILVTDGTRPGSNEGDVLAQSGSVLTLSQKMTPVPFVDYFIVLQLPDGTTQAIDIADFPAENQVTLAALPSVDLALDADNWAKPLYSIYEDGEENANAFLVTEKEPANHMTVRVNGVNYDKSYYANDKDYVNNVIDIDGNLI